jgi:branched-chain amino acid transport system permease protein
MDYLIHVLIMINIYIIIVTSTNLLVGMTNLLSMGQAALYGIGAYIAVLSVLVLKLSILPSLLLVFAGTSLISLIIAYPSVRLKGDYFVLATLGFQLIVSTIFYNWVDVTRGPFGISGIPAPVLWGDYSVSGTIPYLVLSSILSLTVLSIFFILIYSPFGRALKAVRDDELSLQAVGKNVTALKIWAFALSSGFVGISGFIYATYVSYIDPTSFTLDQTIFILSAVLIGGTGNIKGPVLGAVFVVVLPEALRFVGLPDNIAANLRQIIYGLMIILFMRLRSQGLAGEFALK